MKKLTSAIDEYLHKHDPKGKIVLIDHDNKIIHYNPLIVCHSTPKYEKEGFVRAYLVVRLVKELGYSMDSIEIEHDISANQGRTKKHSGQDRGRCDLLLFKSAKKDKLFLGIECKIPTEFNSGLKDIDGQLWGIGRAKAIQSRVKRNIDFYALYSCDIVAGAVEDKVILVSNKDFPTYEEWNEAGKPSDDIIPREYGDPYCSVFANILDEKDEFKPLRKDFTQGDFSKLRESIHKTLWGGGSTADNAIFDQLTRVFLVKIYDETFTNPEMPYEVQIRRNSDGDETPEQLIKRLDQLYALAASRLLNYDDDKIAALPFLSGNVTASKVKAVIKEIQSISITENEATASGHDFLGEFFEGILTNQSFYKQERGTFFTHQTIVRFINGLISPDELTLKLLKNDTRPRLPYVIDPSCGSGTFLIEIMKLITSRLTSTKQLHLNKAANEIYGSCFRHPTKPNIWAEDYLYGIEPRPDLGLASKVNMILHGDGNMNIFIEDGLRKFDYRGYERIWEKKDQGRLCFNATDKHYGKQTNEAFEVIVSNPPFSIDTEALESAPTLPESFYYHNKNNSENIFIERYYQLLAENGFLGVVLPETFFDTDDNTYIRCFLYKFFKVKAVVSLPPEAFEPHTKTKTSILLAQKKTKDELYEFEKSWKKASNKYTKLRGHKFLQLILENDKQRNELKAVISRCKQPFYLDYHLLFSPDGKSMIDALISQISLSDKAKKRVMAVKSWADETSGLAIKKSDLNSVAELIGESPDDMSLQGIEEKYFEIIRFLKIDYPDYEDKQAYCNARWCFMEVTKDEFIDYEVFFAEVKNIGFKRFRRSQRSQSFVEHDLYSQQCENGFPLANPENPKAILDWYKKFSDEDDITNTTPENIKIKKLSSITQLRGMPCGYRSASFEHSDEKNLIEVGTILTLEYGKPLTKQDRKGGAFPVVGSNGIIGYHDCAITDGPTIVIGRKGSAGIVKYYESGCWPIDTALYVKLRPNYDQNFKVLAFLLKSLNLERLVLRKAVPGLNRNDVYNLFIPKLSPAESKSLLKEIEKKEADVEKAELELAEAIKALDSISLGSLNT